MFKNLPLGDSTGARGSAVPAEERKLLDQDWFRNSRLAADFEDTGFLDVGFRSSIVRIASAKLALAAVVALATATAAPTAKLGAGCGIAGGVCVVAFAYYRMITRVREQQAPRGYAKLALRWVARGAAAPTEGATAGQRTFAQELQVDGLRFSDWITTLVFMTVELHLIADDAAGDDGFLGLFWGSTLVAFQVLFGTIPKSYFNSLRKATAADGARVEQPLLNWALSLIGFALGVAIFVAVNVDLVVRAGWPGDLSGHARDDALAVWLVCTAQIGYPILYVVEWLWLRLSDDLPEDEYSAALSGMKDIVIAFLDISTKAGTAFWSVVRAWRV